MYTNEENSQITIALLKAHGIKQIVVSPGATNQCFVLSVQHDSFFKLYSAVDERHAAYLAVGLSEETGDAVVINCTGATASRNYLPALTEAYYRKLPILVITSSQHSSHIGNLWPQMTDRMHLPSDVVTLSVQCPIPKTKEDRFDCELKVNAAILALRRHGGGPAHINLETSFSKNYSAVTLPNVRVIKRIRESDSLWPQIPENAKIAVFIGSHLPFNQETIDAIERFSKSHNAVVLGDLTSNYTGPSFVQSSLACSQQAVRQNVHHELKPDLIIHIGEISADYPSFGFLRCGAPVWRVSRDGELRDFFWTLHNVFEMDESTFFAHYEKQVSKNPDERYLSEWKNLDAEVRKQLPEVPFSNVWIAKQLSMMIPQESELHLGILNPIRCWNLFHSKCKSVFSNVGGFGIDGCISSMIGASFSDKNCIYYGVFGDLSFFYDLNSIGNRHIGKNIRILVINNGEGGEFSIPGHIGDFAGDDVHSFIAARGHFGYKSKDLIRHYAENLGFKYLSASSKDDFATVVNEFISSGIGYPILFECFTSTEDEHEALLRYESILESEPQNRSSLPTLPVMGMIKSVVPSRIKNAIKELIK